MGRVAGSTFRWTKEATEALLHSLIDSTNVGLRADLGYSHRAWVYAVQFASEAQGGEITVRQAKTKHDGLKADYKIWLPLLKQPWFNRDADGDIAAPEAEWNAYINAHPEAKKFKNSQIEFENLLDILFPEVRAKVEHAKIAPLPVANGTANHFDQSQIEVRMDMPNLQVDPRITMSNPQAQVRIPRPEAPVGIANQQLPKTSADDHEENSVHDIRFSSPPSSSQRSGSVSSSGFSWRKRAASQPGNPLTKRNKQSEGEYLADSIKGLASSLKMAAKTFEQGSKPKVIARAAALFFEDNKDWPYEDQSRVTEALEDEAKARIYLIAPREYRDGWVKGIVGRTNQRSQLSKSLDRPG